MKPHHPTCLAIAILLALIVAATPLPASTTGDLLAFPGAEGFGDYAKGGRGGRALHVTNLNDHGEGSLQGKDAIDISEGTDIIVDHCSASWSLDEVLSASIREPTLTRVTVQWCFITEGLNPSNHGFGPLIRGTGGAQFSFLRNLYAHNFGRHPAPALRP